MRVVARELLLKTGLLSSLEFRSVAQKDEQTPRPGTMVPRGTIVRTRIGIGDYGEASGPSVLLRRQPAPWA
jgi:hypothetical protein